MNCGGRAVGANLLALALTVSAVTAADLPPRARLLPSSLHGVWGYEAADCDHPESDGLLTIEDRTILFFASGYDVTRVVRRHNGSLRASGRRSDEGETGRSRGALTLKLLTPDRLHVATRYSGGHVYYRCPNAPR